MDDIERLSVNPRTTIRRDGAPDPEGAVVLYWMQRAQRGSDNAALDAAITVGNALGKPVAACFALAPSFPGANLRHYRFMVDGLADVAADLRRRGVALVVRIGEDDAVLGFAAEAGAALVVGDENPLREPERWRRRLAERLRVPFWTVDADVVVPARLLEKEQYAARTIRPRIQRQLPWFLARAPEPRARVPGRRPRGLSGLEPGPALIDRLDLDRRAAPVMTFEPGPRAARRRLREFARGRLSGYASGRNHPEADHTSRLSPYLHFGHLGPREVAEAVSGSGAPAGDREAFLEQLIVRRELAVNFVRYNPRYDTLDGCERWAVDTLARQADDTREWLYDEQRLEEAGTHDPLWNAAQRQMVETGWMHGYVRMYWAKKILEWTRSPAEAMAMAIALNDRYELDGRDPNGYAGIAWAIGGKHDRPWAPRRPVFGTIRYMSYASTSKKFDSRAYIARWGRR